MNFDAVNQELLHPLLFWRVQHTSPARKHSYSYESFPNLESNAYSTDTDENEIITVVNELRSLLGDETPGFNEVAYSDEKVAWTFRIVGTQTVPMDVVQGFLVRMHEPDDSYSFSISMTGLGAASFEAAYRNRIFERQFRALAA